MTFESLGMSSGCSPLTKFGVYKWSKLPKYESSRFLTFKKATAPLLSSACAFLHNKTPFSTASMLEIEGGILS